MQKAALVGLKLEVQLIFIFIFQFERDINLLIDKSNKKHHQCSGDISLTTST